MTVQEEMKQLVIELNEATEAYDKGHPIMTDAAWDEKYFRLVELESQSGFSFAGSPTRNIHFVTVSKLNKVEHNHKMLSLDKTKEIEEVKSFLGTHPFIAMDKMDGLTCSLKYLNGILVSAETRGNGIIGEDILHNAKIIPSIPNIIDNPNFTEKELIIDGEIICSYKDFANFSNEYKNPRNFASGSIRLLSSKECAERKLQFVAWDVIEGFEEKTLHGKLQHLKALGFTTVPYVESGSIEDMIEELKTKAQELSYPIDGVVFKFDDIEYGKTLGETSHHFRNALAYKFYDEEYETKLKYIEWSMGRTGVLTPVAVFEPIDIDGTEVERASLHNYSIMKEIMGDCCYCGQKINVYKANMIIPQISSAVKMSYGDVISLGGVTCDGFSNDYGIRCPVCEGSTSLVKSSSGTVNLVCDNPNCEGKLINRLDHFCSKKGLEIKGLSKATLEKLIDWGWIGNVREIFSLSNFKNEWKNKTGFGEKSVNNILESIENSKACTLEAFISSLGIPLVGRTVSRDISNLYPTWSDFKDAVGGRWSDLNGFGPELEKAINTFDYSEADEIAAMLTFKQPDIQNNNSSTANAAVFVITGKLSKSRALIQADIEASGGKVGGSITGKTNYLVCNKPEDSAKYKTAVAKGLPIITEEELYKML